MTRRVLQASIHSLRILHGQVIVLPVLPSLSCPAPSQEQPNSQQSSAFAAPSNSEAQRVEPPAPPSQDYVGQIQVPDQAGVGGRGREQRLAVDDVGSRDASPKQSRKEPSCKLAEKQAESLRRILDGSCPFFMYMYVTRNLL